jgi:probable HAF family extracellular repeat protein
MLVVGILRESSHRYVGGANFLHGGCDMRSRFAKHSVALITAYLLIDTFAWSAHGATFFGLGSLPEGGGDSFAHGVSADGSVVVGNSGSGFRWTKTDGMISIGDLGPSKASADGSVVVGGGFSGGNEAFRWTADGGAIGLGYLSGRNLSTAYGVSADGSLVVGESWSNTSPTEAFRWTNGTGMAPLGYIPGGYNYSAAYAVSADGTVIVGEGLSASGFEAFRWTSDDGMVALGDLPGGYFGSLQQQSRQTVR